ncbi:F-actin-monooxygenase Mical isoform X2 [Episyrphus balteatus]|uniref:F-actin-monooxygenase Mical isoform X2 n=1 Tax=Episyrphus balteatus TaxID=286459 RepID=UPI0024860A91|nr:F-actin-monooxygenase Mical isoform X2 [Episyrphus balteatus]
MSRSSNQRQQQQLLAQQQQQMADNDAAAAAAEMFDMFCLATTMRQVLGLHRNICDAIGLRPAPLNEFYPKLKAKIRSWKAQALWKKFDARASHRAYSKGNACTGTRVLVIGAGPCGLRTAIEAQLLGAKVVVVEKRDRISRNNVLHLWPFVITDLRNLGAKKFYGKFCAGSIDHISIRQIQCILLKVALLLGVEVHEGVSFEGTIEPSEGCGWRAAISPEDHAVSHYEFDVLIGADGKRNTLEAFKRKEFRGKLAIAITANFINKKTEAEAKAEEISGVAFIFNQAFFKELYHTTGIDLENIVYYKDETHYFVMTAKKHSLIDKGVIMQDFADPAELLAPQNVNTDKLLDYAREAAEFSTKYQMPNLEFAVNHYGKPDVAMFDFTSMFAAESSSRVIVRKNYRLLQCLVGDSLLEPFWPTGSGCARGFLSSMDAAYAIKLWNNPRNSILGVLAQRESIYRLLAQTTPENLQRDIGSYTVDPATRYPNLNRTSVNMYQVKHLIDTDDKAILEQTYMDTNALQASQADTPVRRKRRTGDTLPLSAVLLRWIKAQLHSYEFVQNLNEVSDCFTNGKVLCALINRYRPDLVDFNSIKELPAADCNDLAFKILDKELKISKVMSGKDSIDLDKIDSKIWLNYLEQVCEVFRGEIPHVKHPKLDVSELREKNRNNVPDFSRLLQMTSSRKAKSPMQDVADLPHATQRRSVLDEEKVKRQRKHEPGQGQLDTPRRAKKRRSAEKTTNIDRERGISSAMPRGTDEQFSDRIKSMEQQITSRNAYGTEKKPKDLMRAIGKIDSNDWNVREIEKKIEQSKKTEIGLKGREKVPKWSKEQFVARQSKMSKPTRQDSSEEKFKEIDQTLKNLDKQLKEGSVLEVGERGKNKVASIAGQFVKKDDTSEEKLPPTQPIAKSNSKVALAFKKQAASEKCHFCKQTVYLMEKISTEGLILHRSCLKCHHCHTNLRPGGYAFDRDDPEGRFYCTQHFRLPAKAIRPMVRKPGQRKSTAHGSHAPSHLDPKTPEKPRGITESVVQLDLLDRGQTPERIEFENTDAMSDGEPSEEHIIDENEWSGRNFLQPSADSESDLSSSSDESDDDSESDIFEEANGSPIAQQTLQLATDWIGKQHYSNVNSDDSDDDFYDSSEGLADDGKDDTEGEEIKKAREMRREEVRLLPLPTNLPTDTETENQEQVVVATQSPQDGAVSVQKNNEISDSERSKHGSDKISISSAPTPPPTKADIEKIEQNSDRRFSADVDAISEKLYRLNNLMKLNKDIESMAKDNLVKSDIMKKLSLKEKWLLDNSVSGGIKSPALGFPGEKVAEKVNEESDATNIDKDTKVGVNNEGKEKKEENLLDKPLESVTNGDDDHGDGLNINQSSEPSQSIEEVKPIEPDQPPKSQEQVEKEKIAKIASEKMEIEGILDIVKMMDTSLIEPSKQPLPKPAESPKVKKKDPGQMIYDAEQKKVTSLSDALHQIEVRSFAGTMDTIKAQMVMPTVSQQATLDISKYFPNAKQEKQSSASLNKTQKTLKDVDLTKYFPQSPVPQRKSSISIPSGGDKLKKSQTTKAVVSDPPPKAPPRRQKSTIAAPSTDKTFSMQAHQLDGAIDIQKASPVVVVKPVPKKGGIKIVKKIVPKGTKTTKKPAPVVVAKKKIQDEADKILDEILQEGQEVRSPSIEYQKLFTEEKSPSEDISERIEKILEETGIDLGLPPNPKKKLLKAKSLGEEEFKRTQEKTLSREDGDRPIGVKKILQRFESMSSIKSDDSFKLRKTNLSSTCSSLNRSKESLPSSSNLHKSKESLQSSGSLKSNSDSMSDLEKTMEYLKSEWRTEATNFLQKKRDNFYANRDEKKAEAEAESKKRVEPETQWKHTKYSKFFGIKEKSPEKRKSPTKTGKRRSPAKILKKSPREEIMRHRKKVESVMSRTASFEEKIKAEEERLKGTGLNKTRGSQNDLTNGLDSTRIRRDSGDVVFVPEKKIPVLLRKESEKNSEVNKHQMDTAQKVLSRRGSGSSGLADVLKPPVVKGLRGQQELRNKVENNTNDGKNLGRRGSQETLKSILNLVRTVSQSNMDEDLQQKNLSSQSPGSSQNNVVAQEIVKELIGVEELKISEEEAKKLIEEMDSVKSSDVEPSSESVKEDDIIEQMEEQTKFEKSSIITSVGSTEASEDPPEAVQEIVSTASPLAQSRRGSQNEPIGTPPQHPSRRGSQNQISSIEADQNVTSRRNSQVENKEDNSKSPLVQSRRGSQVENKEDDSNSPLVISRGSSQVERREDNSKSPLAQSRGSSQVDHKDAQVQSRRGSQVEHREDNSKSPLIQSRRGSQVENKEDDSRSLLVQSRGSSQVENKKDNSKSSLIQSRGGSQVENKEDNSKSPIIQSRRGSQNEASPQHSSSKASITNEDTTKSPSQPLSRRESAVNEDRKYSSEATEDVDDIFNQIITELSQNDEEVARELSLIETARAEKEEEELIKQQEQQQQEEEIIDESEYIAEITDSPKRSRAGSDDSIEELFSQFKNDMLVDVEFDSNDEVVAITPRAVLVNEDEEDPEEEEDEKPITVEEAKLKFEPLFPRLAKPLPKDSSSSMSLSPGRTEDKTKKIVQKLDPSNMPPSVQDMMQLMISREDSEPRQPVAFPRHVYYDSADESSNSSQSRNQTPDSSVKSKDSTTKDKHLEVVYELAWPSRKRTPSPIPESARPPIKPPRENSERPNSRRGSGTSIEESSPIVKGSVDSNNKNESSQDRLSSSQRGSPKLLPSSRRGSRSSSDLGPTENREPQSMSRRGSKASLKDSEDIILSGSPALLPTPRRGSRTSIDSSQNVNEVPPSRRSSPALPASPRTEELVNKNEEIPSRKPTPASDISRESSDLPRDSSSSSLQSTNQKVSNGSPSKVLNEAPEASNELQLPTTPRKDSVSPNKSAASFASSINEFQRESPSSPRTETQQLSREGSQISTKSASQAQEMVNIQKPREGSQISSRSAPQEPSREGSNISSTSLPQAKEIVNIQKSREGSQLSSKSLPQTEGIVKIRTEMGQSPREGSQISTKSPPRAEGMVNIVELLNEPPKRDSESSSRKSVLSKSNTPTLPESPQSARARFFAQNQQSAESSPRESKERLIPNNEPSKEYRDLLRAKLESPTPRNPSQSRERSLEWDMEQLPKSPMPRRKFMPMYRNESSDKEESPQQTSGKSAPDIRIPTKRLEEWEIIEQLERERRHALIARDQNYSHQVRQEAPKIPSKQENPPPPFNRLDSDEPHSSKLIEYIKQETLKDSMKSKEDSPRPPSRPRTPQLSRKIPNNDLDKQVVELLKTNQEPKESPKPIKRKPQIQKTESVEATYEDFARFTRRSPEKDAEPEESDVYESPTASISHHRLSNYHQTSQDSASGTYSPTSSLSRSIEHIAPSRPHRNKSSTLSDNRVDKDTKYLMNRSKHLRNMKRDFMEEKIAGNNPYLKKVIEAQKVSRHSEEEDDDDDDVEVDYTLESYRPKNHTTPRFPTSSSIGGSRRRYEPRYPDYTSSTTDYTSRRPYNPHFSATSTSSSAGSRNFVDYFKRSPPHYKGRETSKDSCRIS